jgi:hypothetical protein
MNTDIYKKEHTYLLKNDDEYVRWRDSEDLFFAGSAEDALVGVDGHKYFSAERVCDAPAEIQKEYEETIDRLIKSGGL